MRVWPRSLTVRLLLLLFVAQIVTVPLSILAGALYVNGTWQNSDLGIGHDSAKDLLLAALRRAPDGSLRLASSPDLAAFQAARPGFEYAVVDPATGRAVPGSSSILAALFENLGAMRLDGGNFHLPGGEAPDALGFVSTEATPFGQLTFVTYRHQPEFYDVLRFVAEVTPLALPVYGPSCLIALIAAALAVFGALAPLRRAAQRARRIDSGTLSERLPEAGVPSEFLSLVRAINVALDRLDKSFAQQRRFTANAAHEIRTPLAILLARIDTLSDLEAKRALKRDAHRINSLAEQMLAVARLQSGAALDDTIDLVAQVRTIVADYAPLAVSAGRALAFSTRQRGAVPMRGNARAIESAVTNLIDNALHAEPEGGTVEITVGPGVQVAIIDHGAGIAPEDRDNIFEVFWRKDERRLGSGLGLAIVREVALAHGGRIDVEETPGGGATFVLVFPATPDCHEGKLQLTNRKAKVNKSYI